MCKPERRAYLEAIRTRYRHTSKAVKVLSLISFARCAAITANTHYACRVHRTGVARKWYANTALPHAMTRPSWLRLCAISG